MGVLGLLGLKVPAWVYEVAAALLLIAIALISFAHHERGIELAKFQKSSVEVQQEAAKQIADNNAAHAAEVKTNVATTKAAVDAANSLSASLDLSVRNFDAYRRAHPAVARTDSGPGAASTGECGAQSCGDVASAALQDGDRLTGSNAELSAALQGCQRERDALTGLPK